ncbi:MAG: phosphatidate cytidylyltransferase, partial [Clostridiales bacterium]|nr:phosphatidate cytidylyltransferase [Clostridiales bacterium]
GVINIGYGISDAIDLENVHALVRYLVLGLVCSVISQFGDLFASRIKRECGIKDFGKVIPGHGGIIDRIDSVMFSLAAVYLAVTFF